MTTLRFGSSRIYVGALVALAASVGLVGCSDDGYSNLVQYTLRTDPLVLSDKLGEEQAEPDRPGVFPIMSMKDLFNPVSPLFPAREKTLSLNLLRDPTLVHWEDKEEIKGMLEEWFGTPRNPRVKDAPASLELSEKKLAEGSALYRIHCLHCHGVNGDGRGVTAKWINPHPRDFRQGLFKFQSVDQTSEVLPPRREDLKRTLMVGIEGTAMPAFNLLAPKQIDALVSYVIHLSLRGQTEFDTIKNGFDFNEDKTLGYLEDPTPIPEYMTKVYDAIVKKWVKAQNQPIKPATYPYPPGVDNDEYKKSVQRGYKYFIGEVSDETKEAKATNCVTCHVNFGRQSQFKWDAWGTLVRPNNLTNGILRGGRRTIDVYYRIHSGIDGSNMPAFGGNEKTNPRIIWDLVNFVQALPYPAMRQSLSPPIE